MSAFRCATNTVQTDSLAVRCAQIIANTYIVTFRGIQNIVKPCVSAFRCATNIVTTVSLAFRGANKDVKIL